MKSIECPSKLPKRLSPESRRVKPELSAERFQHVRLLDCQERILCEFTGEPVVGEYNGGTSIIQIKVKCPN
ncbi:hypothetical protein [Nostoc sp. ChiVER01]|uniref:hypothetical protein n=1 Tax=Nostoc sp. ChiVER01 TaxID=3075382 RepID=UPI002AD53D6E|nr:hypothetical protein [Nostoc sp. ChiVER01]MDZ8226557.1 hypothetical protein [Nostoc sp. ChiVER01]